jgi:PD-(D/E)XK nuclease superfamily
MQVHYEDKSHTYFTLNEDATRNNYVSATTLIGHYKPKFDSLKVATKYVIEHGETTQYWIDKWADMTDEACKYGTEAHARKENRALKLTGAIQPLDSWEEPDFLKLPDGIYTELKVHDHRWKIAGRIDRATIQTINGIRYMHIGDFKSNKEIKLQSYQFPDLRFKMLLKPLGHIMDSNYWHYVLQLSLYQFMAESLGFAAGSRTIYHIPKVGDYQDYDLPYLRDEILAMLMDAKSTKKI